MTCIGCNEEPFKCFPEFLLRNWEAATTKPGAMYCSSLAFLSVVKPN